MNWEQFKAHIEKRMQELDISASDNIAKIFGILVTEEANVENIIVRSSQEGVCIE
jgi:hypothetical protein